MDENEIDKLADELFEQFTDYCSNNLNSEDTHTLAVELAKRYDDYAFNLGADLWNLAVRKSH